MKLIHQKKHTKGFTLVELLVVIAIIATLAGISSPIILSQVKKAQATKATAGAKDIYVALLSFQQQYGTTPCTQVATDQNLTAPTDANGHLRLLFETGLVNTEQPFFANATIAAGVKTKKPDNNFSTPAKTLESRENVWTYFATAAGIELGGNVRLPILGAPINAGDVAAMTAFDSFGNKAVILWSDGAVEGYDLKPTDSTVIGMKVTKADGSAAAAADAPAFVPTSS